MVEEKGFSRVMDFVIPVSQFFDEDVIQILKINEKSSKFAKEFPKMFVGKKDK